VNKSELDRLGVRLRRGELNDADLTLLDSHRRRFSTAYEAVVNRIRSELGCEVSGRPAKSTTAIVDKLRRSHMRLTQMQDIAGCRIVVSDVLQQDQLVKSLGSMFDVLVFDRRLQPSFGYRAVHVIVRHADFPVEIQVRTALQHDWAKYSEKIADRFGHDLKYGGGDVRLRAVLTTSSSLAMVIESKLDPATTDAQTTETVQALLRDLLRRLSDQLDTGT
jgi:putative GTP pyrophosphokinase